MKSKEREYHHFMKDLDPDPQTQPSTAENQREDSESPEPLSAPMVPEDIKFSDENMMERRKQYEIRNAMVRMESVQERSGEEDGTETPHEEELEDDSNKHTPRNSLHSDGAAATKGKHSSSFDLPSRQPHSLDYPSLPHSLRFTSRQSSLVSSFSSVDNGPRPLLSNQFSITSSITNSLAELLAGSPTTSMPEDLYQLKLLWNGIKTAISQKRQRLEQIRDLWKSFEGKKEEFVNFLTMAEERLGGFQETLGQTMDMGAIQNEIETQKVCVIGIV